MHLALLEPALCAPYRLWEPCRLAKVPDGTHAYIFNILRLQEEEAQMRLSE
jgi:hypothetical protein